MARSRKSSAPSVDQLLSKLAKGELLPVYVFYGPNNLLIEQAVAKLKARVVGDNEEFAYQAFRGEESKEGKIANAARTQPMLAEEQLIVVRHADALNAAEQATILKYVKDPNPATCLVLTAAKLDRRLKLWNQAGRLGFLFEAPELTERELHGWISARAGALGVRLSAQAAHLLGEATGTDPATVEDALERLCLYVGDRGEATAEDVEAVVSVSRVRSIFELTDALGHRNLAQALRVLSNMLQNREAPLRILATLATHMRRLLTTAELGPAYAGNHFQLASKLGLPPFVARKVADQARHFSRPDLRRALRRLAQTDIELKSARRADVMILEEMVMDLCLPARGAAARRTAGRA